MCRSTTLTMFRRTTLTICETMGRFLSLCPDIIQIGRILSDVVAGGCCVLMLFSVGPPSFPLHLTPESYRGRAMGRVVDVVWREYYSELMTGISIGEILDIFALPMKWVTPISPKNIRKHDPPPYG